ncbi:MAG TPA: response regulator transcription factor [Cellulomonas sp.]
MTSVLIVDDQSMIRMGLRTILEAQAGLTVEADVGDGLSALAVLASGRPVDVVLMDLRMPGIDGVETTRRIRERHAAEQVRILVLTTFEEDANVLAALRAGADGFLGKGVGPAELAEAVLRVSRGDHALSDSAVSALVEHVAEGSAVATDLDAAHRFEALTPREREVVVAITRGLDNVQIAQEMFLSPLTVKTHANRAMMKVGVRDRAQLVALAYQAGVTR